MEYFGYIFFAVPFVAALLFGLLVVVLLFFVVRSAGFGVGAIAILYIFEANFPGFQGVNLGIRIDAPDLISLLLAVAVLFRLIFIPAARPALKAWYIVAGGILVSLVWGLATLGTAGGVAARPYFYALAVMSYVLTFPGDQRLVRQLFTALAWIGVCTVALVVFRWFVTYLPIPALLPPEGRFSSVESSRLRVIPSFEAMLLAQLVLVGIFYPAVVPLLRWLRPLVPLALLTVIVLQHRSVWIAIAAGAMARFALPEAGRKATLQLAAVGTALSLALIPLVSSDRFTAATADIGSSAKRAIAGADTVNFRLDSWDFALRKWSDSGPVSVAIGLPMGTSMERLLRSDSGNYQRVQVSAHNFYVETLFYTGLVGILAVLSMYGFVIVNLVRGMKDSQMATASGALFLLIVSQLFYYVAYGVDYFQGLIFGVAAAVALTISERRRAAPIERPLGGSSAYWSPARGR